jgi:hypothetical protein
VIEGQPLLLVENAAGSLASAGTSLLDYKRGAVCPLQDDLKKRLRTLCDVKYMKYVIKSMI